MGYLLKRIIYKTQNILYLIIIINFYLSYIIFNYFFSHFNDGNYPMN